MWARRLIDRHDRKAKARARRDPDPARPEGSRVKVAAVATAAEPGDSRQLAGVKAQLRLREMILAGELPGGARIAEVAISEQLGVSRTPVRTALMRLEQEGLLEALPNGGYAVRTFRSATWPMPSSCAARSKGWSPGSRPSAARRPWCCASARLPAAHRRTAARARARRRGLLALRDAQRALPRTALRNGGQPRHRAAARARDQPAVRVALGLRHRAGQLAGRTRHARDCARPALCRCSTPSSPAKARAPRR